jgi:DNA recombination protein RmuC
VDRATFAQQVDGLRVAQSDLRTETSALSRALRAPSARGQWGELQLRRVVEISGMTEHCDFFEQETSDVGRKRADMIVRLPGDRVIVVDSKAPLGEYQDAAEAQDDAARDAHLRRYAQNVRRRIDELARKEYAEAYRPSLDMVVMFLPGEHFFGAALEHDPRLHEYAMERHVLLASPMTLLALLHATAYGWRRQQIAENAEAISALGRDLYDRIRTWTQHLEDVGEQLGKAVESYNASIGSLERRVLPGVREFTNLGVAARKEIPELTVIDSAVRQMRLLEDDLTPSRIG